MSHKETFSLEQELMQDLVTAKQELLKAEQNFEYADMDNFDIINSELTIAKLKYQVCFQKIKQAGLYNINLLATVIH